ncbi:hypothetical protein C8J57DRAFT_1220061 [Mycena rebaudengoi]|nr:hypothetical protein C8J57DRAFT_1220061 [Mycena rebaudengoi]
MQSSNQTRSHYREHTRQQDGWTVLAPPPGPELPPPYTPEAAPQDSNAAAGLGFTSMRDVTLAFDIPINSTIIGAQPVTQTKHYGRNVPFAHGYVEICRMMGDRANAPTHALATAADWDNCLETGIGLTRRARTRQVVCMIRNLNLPTETATTPSASVAGTKRKSGSASGSASADAARKTFDYTKEYRRLKTHLACTTHKGDLCFVSPADGHHVRVDPEHVSLWAKEISFGHATTNKPPENIMFQDFFGRERKRRNTRSAPSQSVSAPTIHVTVNTGPSGGGQTLSPPRRSPLGTITAANANVDNIPTSPYRSQSPSCGKENMTVDVIRFPSVAEVLQMIDDSGVFEDSVELTFPAVVFADGLRDFQITHVDQVVVLDADFYVQQINMPVQLAELFVEESFLAMGRAQKGKCAA